MSKEFFDAVKLIEAERGIPCEHIYEMITSAIISSLKREYNGKDIIHCDIDEEKQKIKVYVQKTVVDEIDDPDTQLTLAQAQLIRKSAKVGKTVDIPIKTKDLGRVIAQKAKQLLRSGLRDIEKGQMYEEFKSKNQELVSGKIDRIDPTTGNALIIIGKNAATLPKAEQVPGEKLREGDTIKVFIVDVKETTRGPRIMISRTHPGLVRRLFEQEVPEIYDGTIEIKSVAREAGSRSKISVYSKDEDVDPVGACIGPKGQRVSGIVEALGGEKIDIVKYSDDPVALVSAALAPSEVCRVEVIDEEKKTCRATVPDDQLSLAIGNKGQNVRLAVRLTGWNIDIKPESGFFEGKKEEEASNGEAE